MKKLEFGRFLMKFFTDFERCKNFAKSALNLYFFTASHDRKRQDRHDKKDVGKSMDAENDTNFFFNFFLFDRNEEKCDSVIFHQKKPTNK